MGTRLAVAAERVRSAEHLGQTLNVIIDAALRAP